MTSDAPPLVSIIIPCYNAEPFVRQAIESVLHQSCPHKEVIVIDDGSDDGSLDVIRSFGDRIKWKTGPNKGACAARNRGLELARGKFCLFLDADDYVEGGLIAGLVTLAAQEQADIVFGRFCYAFLDGRRIPGYSITRAEDTEGLVAKWLRGNFIPPCSVLWRSKFVQAIGGWDLTIPRDQDGELIYRALLSDAVFAISEDGCGVYVQHTSPNRVSVTKSPEAFEAQLRIYNYVEIQSRERQWRKALSAVSKAYYGLACSSYFYDNDSVAREALARARALGLRGHNGTIAHRVASSVLGLRTKEKLAALLKKQRF